MAGAWRRRHYVGMGVASALGSFGFFSIAFLVGAVSDRFGAATLGGLVAAAEFAALGLSSLLAMALLHRYTARNVALLSVTLVLLGQGMSALALSEKALPMLLIARIAVGFGEGLLYAQANGFASRTALPVRIFSAFALVQVVFSMLTFALLTRVFPPDPVLMPLIFGGMAAVVAPLLLLVPAARFDAVTRRAEERREERLSIDAWLALGGLTAFWIAAYLMIPFSERIGLSHGFTRAEIAAVIALHSLPSFVAPPLAAMMARVGSIPAIVAIILCELVALWAIMFTTSLPIWTAGILGYTFLMYLFFPLFNGAMARLDPSGRANMLAVTVSAGAAVAGPLMAAAVIGEEGGYERIWPLGIAVYAVMLLLILRPLYRADRMVATAQQAAP